MELRKDLALLFLSYMIIFNVNYSSAAETKVVCDGATENFLVSGAMGLNLVIGGSYYNFDEVPNQYIKSSWDFSQRKAVSPPQLKNSGYRTKAYQPAEGYALANKLTDQAATAISTGYAKPIKDQTPTEYNGRKYVIRDAFNLTAAQYEKISPEGSLNNDMWAYIYEVCHIEPLITNSAPTVINRVLELNEDSNGSISITAADPDAGDFHTFSISTQPSAGTAKIVGSTLTYTPPADWFGTTTLQYAAVDNKGASSNVATVTITVNPVNDAPVAQPKTLTTNEDTPGSVTLSATDIDSPAPTTFQIVTGPSVGSAGISGSTLNYTPPPEWSGATSLTYRAMDSAGALSAPVTVSIVVIAVNDPPVAAPKSMTMAEDTAGSVTLSATDVDSPAPTVFQLLSAPAGGTAVIVGSTLTFTPAPDWSGSTNLTYRAQDSGGAWSAPATVLITVTPVNDAPVAVAKSLTIAEDAAGVVTLSVVDPDIPYGDTHTFEIVSGPATGTATLSGTVVTYTPPADWFGSTSFTYRVKDAAGVWSAAATVSITVTPVNDAPVAQPKTLTTDEDTSATVTLTATDIDSPVPVVFQVVTSPNPAQGSVAITGSVVTFTPAPNWHGALSFTYRAEDTAGAWSAPVAVSVTVNSVNDVPAPSGNALKISTQESKPATVKYRVAP